jgi:hypothetical protein
MLTQKNLHTNIYNNFICNNQTLEKQDSRQQKALLISTKEKTTDTHNNQNESLKDYGEGKSHLHNIMNRITLFVQHS